MSKIKEMAKTAVSKQPAPATKVQEIKKAPAISPGDGQKQVQKPMPKSPSR